MPTTKITKQSDNFSQLGETTELWESADQDWEGTWLFGGGETNQNIDKPEIKVIR